MTKPIPAIVESQYEATFNLVREKHAALREAAVQIERTEKRAVDARRIADTATKKHEELRLELGLALLKARQAWPERGPKAKGWGDYLANEGIEQSTAWRMMEDAKAFHAVHETDDRPHPAESGSNATPAAGEGAIPPSPRQPLGLLADMQLLVGRWEDVLSKDEIGMVDTLISDTPYSKRTHDSKQTRSDSYEPRGGGYNPGGIAPSYDHWAPADVIAFVEAWSPRVRGWMACMTDSELMPVWRDAFERMDRLSFAPVPCVMLGMTVRLAGDGPSSWSTYLMVARPRTASFSKWGTLPGAYVGPSSRDSENGRGKPRWLLDGIVRDYSRPNDLVCDPCAGYGGTLVSSLLLRRRALGAEVDEAAVTEAFARANALNEEPITSTAEETAA